MDDLVGGTERVGHHLSNFTTVTLGYGAAAGGLKCQRYQEKLFKEALKSPPLAEWVSAGCNSRFFLMPCPFI
jgi:hypothetical protein